MHQHFFSCPIYKEYDRWVVQKALSNTGLTPLLQFPSTTYFTFPILHFKKWRFKKMWLPLISFYKVFLLRSLFFLISSSMSHLYLAFSIIVFGLLARTFLIFMAMNSFRAGSPMLPESRTVLNLDSSRRELLFEGNYFNRGKVRESRKRRCQNVKKKLYTQVGTWYLFFSPKKCFYLLIFFSAKRKAHKLHFFSRTVYTIFTLKQYCK